MSDDEIRSYQNSLVMKHEGTAIVLALILGIFMINGVGHIYIGKIRKGIGYLFLGFFIVGFGGFLTSFLGTFSLIIIGFVYIMFLIGQILSVKRTSREFNDYFVRTKRRLW